jgi:hypothetical protein
MLCLVQPRARFPLRRAAGERAGPIAKRWEGEVVFAQHQRICLRTPPHPNPLRPNGAEREFDKRGA